MASWDYGGLRANTCLFHQETWGHFFTPSQIRATPPPPPALLLLTPSDYSPPPPQHKPPSLTHIHTHTCGLHACTDLSNQARERATTHRWTHTPAEPPNCPNCGVLGEEFNSEWVALQVLGISCLGVNVRQKDKDGHFTGHWLLLPADQPHYITPLYLCTRGSVMQLEVVPSEMLCLYPFPPGKQV